MSQGIIVLGDRTSHGGTVISASPESSIDGKGIARIGDMVACPRCRGVFPINQGDPSAMVDGAPAAYHGCKVACGASLIAGQQNTVTDPSAGTAPGAAAGSAAQEALAQGFGTIGAGLMARYQDQPQDDHGQRFKGRFQVLDQTSGRPMSSQSVRVRSTGGQYLTGHTDAEGFTQWVKRDADEALAFDMPEQGQA